MGCCTTLHFFFFFFFFFFRSRQTLKLRFALHTCRRVDIVSIPDCHTQLERVLEAAEPAGGTIQPAVECEQPAGWRANNWRGEQRGLAVQDKQWKTRKQREVLWQDEDGLGAARGHFSHCRPQQLCSPRLLTLRAARGRTVPLGGLQQAECSALRWNLPPLENKARIKHLVAVTERKRRPTGTAAAVSGRKILLDNRLDEVLHRNGVSASLSTTQI